LRLQGTAASLPVTPDPQASVGDGCEEDACTAQLTDQTHLLGCLGNGHSGPPTASFWRKSEKQAITGSALRWRDGDPRSPDERPRMRPRDATGTQQGRTF